MLLSSMKTPQWRSCRHRRLRWTPSLGPGTVEIKVWRRLPFLFSSSSKESSSRFLLFFLSLLWVCGQRVCVVQAKRHIHSFSRSLALLQAVAPHVYWSLVAQCLVRPPMVVELHPLADPDPRFAAVGVGLEMNLLIFDRAPQPLDEDVVHEAAASVHRNRDPGGLQLAGERGAGELRALVGVEYPRFAVPLQSFLQRFEAER